MRRTLIATLCVALALIVIVGAGLQGEAGFGGPRWIPKVAPATSIPVPSQQNVTSTPKPQGHASAPAQVVGPLIVLLVIAIVLLLIAAFLLWRRLRARRTMPHPFEAPTIVDAAPVEPDDVPEETPDARTVHRGIARAIDLLDAEREPHDAIVKAWLGLQDAAEESGVTRRPAETPAEFTARVVRRTGADSRSAALLLRLYQDVRFGHHEVDEGDVARARDALRRLADAWHPESTGASGSRTGQATP